MKWKNLTAFMLSLFAVSVFAADPAPAGPVTVKAPGIAAGEIKLVDRDQLRVGRDTKRFALNKQMRVALGTAIPVPATWDFTKANTISFPMLGNDQWGDCYYVAACKYFIAANANATNTNVTFDTNKVVARYRQLSRGDNGLSDSQIFPEMKSGVVGPNGPHKIIDYAVVSSTDHVALGLCQYAFGPTLFTFAVPNSVMQNIKPGVLWDTQSGNYIGGHAVLLTGKNAKGNYSLQTWGLNPPVEVTPKFMANNDPESIAVFSLEWFNAKGYAANGFHYTTLAPLWESLTGGKLPSSPFPPPDGPTPPVPPGPTPNPTPDVYKYTITFADLSPARQAELSSLGVSVFSVEIGGLKPTPTPPKQDPYGLVDYKALIAHVTGGQKAFLAVGIPDPYVNSYQWHCRVDSLEGTAPGLYACFLLDGKPTFQRQPDPLPKPPEVRLPTTANTQGQCTGPNCPQSSQQKGLIQRILGR